MTDDPSLAGPARRLLVVEDSERDFALLSRELNKARLNVILHRVDTAPALREALAEGGWDAVISDHSLPELTSVVALKIVRETGLDIPFIIVSGAIGEEQAVDSMKAGAQDYVSKRNLGRLIPVLEREWREAHERRERRRAEAEVEQLSRERDIRLRQRSALLDITNAVVANLDRPGLLRSILDALQTTLSCDRLFLTIRNKTIEHLEVTRTEGAPEFREIPEGAGMSLADLETWSAERYWLNAGLDPARPLPCSAILRGEKLQSTIGAPLGGKSGVRGFLIVASRERGAYTSQDGEFFAEVCGQVAIAIDNMLAYEEIAELKARLEQEKAYLLDEIKTEHNFDEMIGSSPAFLELTEKIRRIAPTSAPVLIMGETGTGKELIARALHNLSPRRDRPLVKVNCAAISAGLVESELFGHVKGAFTGAVDRRAGRFEFADGGTVFLDEVGELPLETQAKLLRVLQEQEFEPVGSNRTVRVDTWVIAATNRRLEDAVRAGTFRSDLYYRLHVVPIEVPPLRHRKEDIPKLVAFFLAGLSRRFGHPVRGVSEEAMKRMLAYSWPGNIRELQNVLARAGVLATGPILGADSISLAPEPASSNAPREIPVLEPPAERQEEASLEAAERRHIISVLGKAHWVLEGPRGAAKILGLHPNTLRSRMKRLGIRRPSPAPDPLSTVG
jgi:formate hydrogenlyase transcriptional activator